MKTYPRFSRTHKHTRGRRLERWLTLSSALVLRRLDPSHTRAYYLRQLTRP